MGLQELGGWEDSHKESVEGTANFIVKLLFFKQMKNLKFN